MKHRLGLAASLALLAGLLVPSSGVAATTIGEAPPSTGAAVNCPVGDSAHIQSTVAPASGSYTVPPGGGVITMWKHQAEANPLTLALGVYRDADAVPGGTMFIPLAESDLVTTTPSSLNTFETRIPVTGGELIGMHLVTAGIGCRYLTGVGTDQDASQSPPPPMGMGAQSFGNVQSTYRLNVAAVVEPDADGDGFGDETQDSCPADANAQDCVSPEVTIDKGPRKQSKKKKAKFKFSSNEAGATFECSIDGKAFKACASPFKVKKLKPRKHVFEVHAVDASGNVSADAVYKWKVKKKKKK